MPRRSLKPQLNQIRTWVRQGRTDAWIAHQLEVSVSDIRSFKRDHELAPGEAPDGEETTGGAIEIEELDLRAEDDALVAAALDAEAAEPDEPEEERASDSEDEGEDEGERKPRRRGRRGGRGRAKKKQALEGTFDHGEEGYGLWLDPAVQDDPVYAEHWAGHRPVTVVIEDDQIIITRSDSGDDS